MVYMMDKGYVKNEQMAMDEELFTGFSNSRLVPELNDGVILENINKIQRSNQIEPSKQLEGRYIMGNEKLDKKSRFLGFGFLHIR